MKKIGILTIIGVGLIGGSMARRAKKDKLAARIIGFGRRKSSLDKALNSGAIDEATLSFEDAAKDADVVVIATPVSLIPVFLEKCRQHCKPGCIITDVGSTKQEITRFADKILGRDKFFVGAHPMAGSEKKGFAFSKTELFDNSICFLTPTKKTNNSALKKMTAFWRRMGAAPVIISAQKHDKIVAEISHLPHVAAVSLVNCARLNVKFAANSFRDTTRVASSDSDIWMDIFFSNKNNVIKSIDDFIKLLRQIRSKIRKKKRSELRRILEGARVIRNKLIEK